MVGLFLFWGLMTSLFVIFPVKVQGQASYSGIIISEILPNPASPLSDTTDEWIEIKNTNTSEVDISGCKLKDKNGTVKEYSVPPNTVISPNGFVVFYSRDTKISLNNDTDGAVMQDPRGGLIVETVAYKNAPSGQSFVLKSNEWGWSADMTPGFELSSARDVPSPGAVANSCTGLIISEIMPDPVSPLTDTSDEWIEIYNETGDAIDVGGCILADTYKPGSTHEYNIPPGILQPGGFMVLYSKNTKINLNNSDGDSVRILSSDRKVVFETGNYGKAKAGQTWAYDGDKWYWTVTSTAGALNAIEQEEGASPKKTKNASSKGKSTSEKTKSKSKPVSKTSSSKKKTTEAAEVLGVNSQDDAEEGKISDKVMGYILVGLSAALLVGYVVWINKDFLMEHTVDRLKK